MKNLVLIGLILPIVTGVVSSLSCSQPCRKSQPRPPSESRHGITRSQPTYCRRDAIFNLCIGSVLLLPPPPASAATTPTAPSPKDLSSYRYVEGWRGTSLSVLSPSQAASLPGSTFPMGRWPDPVLRRTAKPVGASLMGTEELREVACRLRRTAEVNGAVGLAAQQCTAGGIFLVNPRIIARSPETRMAVWNEKCLVLPPTVTATVLRDAVVTVRYETLGGATETVTLEGEAARAAQHEMDHDRGILLLDHLGLDELETEEMRRIEREGHGERMALAYARTT